MSVKRAGGRRQRGFVLIAMCACMFLLLASLGLAFDLGRIYIVRNEGQIFVDAAALAASAQIDGSSQGLTKARAAVERLPDRWNLSTESFKNIVVEFSGDGSRWETQPKDVAAIRLARVTAPGNRLDMTFVQTVGGPFNLNVAARATAATNPVRLVE